MEKTIICNRIVIHMMDFEHNQIQHSNAFIDLNPTSLEYYDKKLEKVFYHPNLKETEVGNFHVMLLRAKGMLEDEQNFIAQSKITTQELFDLGRLIQDMPNCNILFVDCKVDGMQHIVIMKLNYKIAACNIIEEDQEGNQIIRISQKQMLPSKSQGVEEAIIVNLDTNQLFLIEKKFLIDGRNDFYLNQQYIKGQPKMNDTEKIKILTRSVSQFDHRYHVNDMEASALLKQALTDCVVSNQEVKPIQIAEKILERDYQAQEECTEKMRDLGIMDQDIVEVNDDIEKMSRLKIVTDTDVEIRMDVNDYLQQTNVEKKTNQDGTISLIFHNIREMSVK